MGMYTRIQVNLVSLHDEVAWIHRKNLPSDFKGQRVWLVTGKGIAEFEINI